MSRAVIRQVAGNAQGHEARERIGRVVVQMGDCEDVPTVRERLPRTLTSPRAVLAPPAGALLQRVRDLVPIAGSVALHHGAAIDSGSGVVEAPSSVPVSVTFWFCTTLSIPTDGANSFRTWARALRADR